MSYTMPKSDNNNTKVEIVEVDDLPKPSDHESEVLVIERVSVEEPEESAEVNVPQADQTVSVRKPGSQGQVKKREEWIKNWVSRKFNKPKFPRVSQPTRVSFQNTQAQTETTTSTTTTPSPSTTLDASLAELLNRVNNIPTKSSPVPAFVPTLPPQPDSTTQEEAKEAKDPKSLFGTDKYSKYSRNKLNFFTKNKEASRPKVSSVGVPLGAKTDVFKKYGDDKLSMADFERMILGVSTVTETSVKSSICVKGRCYSGDDRGQ